MWHHYARRCPRQHKKHSILATTTTCSWVLHRKHSENTQEYNWIHKNTQEYFELARILKSTQENIRIHKIHSRIHNNTWETSNSANLLEPTLGQCIVLALKPEQMSPLLEYVYQGKVFNVRYIFLCSKQDLSLSLLGKTQNLTGKYRQTNFFASLNANTKQLCRIEICHDRHDRRPCKNVKNSPAV